MRLNWLGYSYRPWDGYGRYSAYLIRALQRAGVDVTPHFAGAADAPGWMLDKWGVDRSAPVISCLPPYYLRKLSNLTADAWTGPHWLVTMTEGSECPNGWAETINKANIEHVIVPCEHNAEAFRRGGVECPVTVIHGGTDPDEFPLRTEPRTLDKPYTFLALADRGKRKGWSEVYDAFYMAFGGKTTGVQDVRLIVKYRPGGNSLIDMIRTANDLDPRIVWQGDDVADIAQVYAQADCFVIPSRSEGWGMPHRECACMGIPVITQAYSGMDDGHTHEWAMVVENGCMEPIDNSKDGHIKGEWRVVDRQELATWMEECYLHPEVMSQLGMGSAAWLRANQTWTHSAANLLALLQREGVLEPERVFA